MIKSLQIKQRIKNLAGADSMEVALADFRSLEEINEYLNTVEKNFQSFSDSFDSIRNLFIKKSAQNRIGKMPWKKNTVESAPLVEDKDDLFSFDAEKVKKHIEKYGERPTKDQQKWINTLDREGTTKQVIPVKIIPHDYNTLKKNFLEIDKWEEQLDSLDSVVAMLATRFKNHPEGRIIKKRTEKLIDDINKKVDKAYLFLEKTARKIAPPVFIDTVEKITEKLDKQFKGKLFEDSGESLYLTAVEKKVAGARKPKYDLKFVLYYRMENLKDESGAHDTDAVLIYVGVVDMDNLNMTMYVTFANDFITPSKVSFGRNLFVDAPSGYKKSLSLISANFDLHEIEKGPLPETRKNIKEFIKESDYKSYISGAEVDEKEEKIVVNFNNKVGDKNFRDVYAGLAKELLMLFKALTKSRINLRMRPINADKKNKGVEYFITVPHGSVKGERLDKLAMEQLKRVIPLTEDEIRTIIRMKNY